MRAGGAFPTVALSLVGQGTGSGNSVGGNLFSDAGRVSNVAKLIVTAISGAAASLALTIEHADLAAGPWTTLDTFPAQTTTTTGITRSMPDGAKSFRRVAWAVTGTTPSITFSVTSARTEPLMLAG